MIDDATSNTVSTTLLEAQPPELPHAASRLARAA
jgi:hypothetical protein